MPWQRFPGCWQDVTALRLASQRRLRPRIACLAPCSCSTMFCPAPLQASGQSSVHRSLCGVRATSGVPKSSCPQVRALPAARAGAVSQTSLELPPPCRAVCMCCALCCPCFGLRPCRCSTLKHLPVQSSRATTKPANGVPQSRLWSTHSCCWEAAAAALSVAS